MLFQVHRRMRLVGAVLVGGMMAATAGAEDFTIVALPDTQNYSQDYPQIYDAQCNWVVNQRFVRNIKFVTHLGDIVNQAATLSQWTNARRSMNILDAAGMPYGTCVGNHDILYPGDYSDPTGLNYRNHFGPQFYSGRTWYRGSSPSGLSNYQVIEADGRQLLFLHLLVETPASELAWAQTVLNANRDKPTMVSTHRYLYDWRILGQGRYGAFQYTFEPPYRDDGIPAGDFFNNFLRVNRQVYMAICGHNDGQYRQVSTSAYGLPIHEILVDYQDSWPNGGNGFLRIMTYRPGANRIEVQSYSPYTGSFDPGGDDTFDLSVNLGSYVTTNPVIRFQDGVSGYASTQDTWVGRYRPDTSHGSERTFWVDDDTENSWFDDYEGQGLLRFDNIFQGAVFEGDPTPTRIPLGANIISANLTINLFDDADAWDPTIYVHRMNRAWSETSTWNSLSGGVRDDIVQPAVATFAGNDNPDLNFHRTFSIRSAVQAWAGGTPNHGLAILSERSSGFDDGIEIRSSEDGDVTLRPALDVEFTYTVQNRAPSVTAPLAASRTVVNEGDEVRFNFAGSDPNPLDPLIFRLNGVDVGYGTGSAAVEHFMTMEDEGTLNMQARIFDDETSVSAGSVTITVLNVAPEITTISADQRVAIGAPVALQAAASDRGILDVLIYQWDLDGDGQYDDFTGASGTTSYATGGRRIIRLRVSDGDGGITTAAFTVEVGPSRRGDLNCDGVVNFDDINGFVAALTGADGFYAQAPACVWLNGDTNCDAQVNFDDIDSFVRCLTGACDCP